MSTVIHFECRNTTHLASRSRGGVGVPDRLHGTDVLERAAQFRGDEAAFVAVRLMRRRGGRFRQQRGVGYQARLQRRRHLEQALRMA